MDDDEEEYSESMSPSEMYVIGKKLYGNSETGFEKWKNDLLNFVTEDFHNSLNSPDLVENKKAKQAVSLWVSTTNLSFFFRGTWGNDHENKLKAMQYLNQAQMLENKYDDQIVIEVIDRAIESCFDNKYEFDNY